MGWKPTAKDNLFVVKRLDCVTHMWEQCQYSDLHKGDIFKTFTQDGVQICPADLSPVDDDWVGVADSDAMKNSLAVSGDEVGWHVITVFGRLPDVLKKLAS